MRISGPVPESGHPNLEARLVRIDALSRRLAAPGDRQAAGGVVPGRPGDEHLRLVADGCLYGIRKFFIDLWNLGFHAIDRFLGYILLGAAIVVPAFILLEDRQLPEVISILRRRSPPPRTGWRGAPQVPPRRVE